MKPLTNRLLYTLFIIGGLVGSVYVYLSFSISKFIQEAIVIWIMITITIFVAMIYEIYDVSSSKEEKNIIK